MASRRESSKSPFQRQHQSQEALARNREAFRNGPPKLSRNQSGSRNPSPPKPVGGPLRYRTLQEQRKLLLLYNHYATGRVKGPVRKQPTNLLQANLLRETLTRKRIEEILAILSPPQAGRQTGVTHIGNPFDEGTPPDKPQLEVIQSPVPIIAKRKVQVDWDKLELKSVNANRPALTNGIMRAVCTAGYYTNVNHGVKSMTSDEYLDVPHEDCTCGFYSVPEDGSAEKDYPGFIAQVELFGRVIECGETFLDEEELQKRVLVWNKLHAHKPALMINPEWLIWSGTIAGINGLVESAHPGKRALADIMLSVSMTEVVMGYRSEYQRILSVDLGNGPEGEFIYQRKRIVQQLADKYPGIDFYIHVTMPKMKEIKAEFVTDTPTHVDKDWELEDVRVTYRAGQPPSYRRN